MLMNYQSVGEKAERISRRVRAADYLTVAQLFLKNNFLLKNELIFSDIKPRLLGHWGTCHGINLTYAIFSEIFSRDKNYSFILGPGHGFPALNANLFLDHEVVDARGEKVTNLEKFCREFSWPDGFPSHSSPLTPGVVTEGGELGYALGAAFGQVLGHPEKTVVVLLGDGEMETATALASMNLIKLIPSGKANGRVIPVLHLNEYKISGPTLLGRKSEHEVHELIRGFGWTPVEADGEDIEEYFISANETIKNEVNNPFFIMRSKKGHGGPDFVDGKKVAGNFLSHQIPLPNAGKDEEQLKILEEWLKSYKFQEVFDIEKGELR